MDWLKALLEALGPLFKRRGADRDFRIKSRLTALVTVGDERAFQGQVGNLSRRGFKLVLPRVVPRDSVVLVKLLGDQIPDTSITVRARVVWSRKQGRDIGAGFEFVGFHDTQYDDVVQFFHHEVRLDIKETAQRLRSPRRTLYHYALRYSPAGDHRSLRGVVQNISFTGLRFYGEEEVAVGTMVHVNVELPRTQEKLTLIVNVRRCSRLKSGQFDMAATLRVDDKYNHDLLAAELDKLAPAEQTAPA